MRRLARNAETLTLSLTRTDGKRFTRVGHGDSAPQRYIDALAQLPPGEYHVDAASTPGTVYSDLIGRDRMVAEWAPTRATSPMNRYEAKRVVIS
jgi:hypothetical protein